MASPQCGGRKAAGWLELPGQVVGAALDPRVQPEASDIKLWEAPAFSPFPLPAPPHCPRGHWQESGGRGLCCGAGPARAAPMEGPGEPAASG